MKQKEIEVGGTYLAKVGARSVQVRIDAANPKGGWNATAVGTGKPVRLKDAKHLRPAKAAAAAGSSDPDPVPPARAGKVAKRAAKKPGGSKAKPVTEAMAADAETAAEAPSAAKAPKKLSCLDAAAVVLEAEGRPMQTKAMVEAMAAKGLWTTSAPTPAATLYSAILRDLKKGAASRFRKTGPGQFDLNAAASADATPNA